MITDHFHHHRAIAGEVYPPEGHRIHWQGMAFFLPPFLVVECLYIIVWLFLVFRSTAISESMKNTMEHDGT